MSSDILETVTLAAAPDASAAHVPALGHYGSFDTHNYGDLLYPLLLDRLLAERFGRPPCRRFGLIGGKAHAQSYPTEPLTRAFDGELDALLVGGGDLIRTDWPRICLHLKPRIQRIISQEVRGRPLLTRLPALTFNWTGYARARFLHPRQRAPFIIDPRWVGTRAQVAYLSVGVVHDLDRVQAPVRAALQRAAIIYARDTRSGALLRDCQLPCPVIVAPDMAVLVSRYFAAGAADRGREMLRLAGLGGGGGGGGRPVLVFQSHPQKLAPMVRALRHVRARLGWDIALLPIGHCLGDVATLRTIAASFSHDPGVRLVDPRTVQGIMDCIAAADAFCGSSMHGNITAFSFGVPHVIGMVSYAKLGAFMRQCGIPAEHRLTDWGELRAKIACVCREPPARRAARALAAMQAVDAALDQVMAALSPALRRQ
jgi:hypothetical protein